MKAIWSICSGISLGVLVCILFAIAPLIKETRERVDALEQAYCAEKPAADLCAGVDITPAE